MGITEKSSMRHRKTREDKTAEQIANILADSRVDLDEVGRVIALAHPLLTFRRLECIIESAQEAKEEQFVRARENGIWN